ncbi:MAG: sulfatase-like hydrolase/transferase [Chloroflexi bacterium]|nr:sulfatase-like hydrolase/transferase [Chloroflexota bacterium]
MKKLKVIHPVLLAFFPILFLYANNVSELRASQIIIPLAVSLGLALPMWLLFGLLFRDRGKAGLAASIFILLFFTYGHFYNQLEKWNVFVPGHGYLLSITLLVFGYSVYFLRRARRDFKTTTRVLNVAAAALVAINAFTGISYQISAAQLSAPRTNSGESAPPVVMSGLPDIYFIILDEYANPDTVKEVYGYDNGKFITSLKNKGFYIANGSISRYDMTIRAIASILNMEHVPPTEPLEATYQRISHNKVVEYLRSIGYSYVYFGQWYEEDRYEIKADRYFNYYSTTEPQLLTSEFSATLWNTTMLRPFYNYVAGERYEGYYQEGLIRTLEQLKNAPEIEGPKFVYAHILSPHAPFVFGPDGERVAPANFYNFDDKQYYLGQYIFISREIDRVIDEILKKSAMEPIIVIQSDHGARWLADWEKILNAFYLPDRGHELLHDSVSPVDTFRIIFDYYFEGNH